MRILNLTADELPDLQGVEEVSSGARLTAAEAVNALGSDGSPLSAAGQIRSAVQTEAYQLLAGHQDDSLIRALGRQDPVLVVLDPGQGRAKDVAKALSKIQIGPEPGTTIPLLIPVAARDRRWLYMGSDSDIRLPVEFAVDQNGDVAGLANFVHRTPPAGRAQIT